jgi:hypothetical protein
MNKRMKHLLSLALDEAVPETWTRLDMDQVKRLCDKFAELILKDVLDITAPHPHSTDEWDRALELASDGIKTQFGVEE